MKMIYVILFFLCIPYIPLIGEDATNFRLHYPKFIPQNSTFDISLVTRIVEPEADNLNIYISSRDKIDLQKVFLRTPFTNTNIPHKVITEANDNNYIYQVSINLNDTLFLPGVFFQLLFTFNSNGSSDIELDFKGEYLLNKEVIRLIPSSVTKDIVTEPFNRAFISFYDSQSFPARALTIKQNSEFQIGFESLTTNRVLLEFWLKINSSDINFLLLKSKTNQQNQYVFNVNNFQILGVTPFTTEGTSIQQTFLSKNAWYHFSVVMDYNLLRYKVYVDGKFAVASKLDFITDINDLIIEFTGNNRDKLFSIEQLRIFDFKNVVDASFTQRHFKDAQFDSSRVIARFNFDDMQAVTRKRNNIYVSFNNIDLTRSDAPIFARSPELNVTVIQSMYQLEWYGGDYRQAQRYVLEKSQNGNDFTPVFRLEADRTSERRYNYTDSDNDGGIVYYRVRQINIDGSIVYSSTVKIGQGDIEPFAIQQNYPNPFNPSTSISVEMFEESFVEIVVYSLVGSELERLHEGYLSKGVHSFTFDGIHLPSGIYLFTVSTPSFSQTRKMILAK